MFWTVALFKEPRVTLPKAVEGTLFIQRITGMSPRSVGTKNGFSLLPVYASPGFMGRVANTTPYLMFVLVLAVVYLELDMQTWAAA